MKKTDLDSEVDKMKKYPCIIPAILEDYERIKKHFWRYFEFLPINELVIIGPADIGDVIAKDNESDLFKDNTVKFINESEILSIQKMIPIHANLAENRTTQKYSSVNWYYQQFLKMAYAYHCTSDYYLCWDSDTMPLKKLSMFSNDGNPYLDIKNEHNSTYFLTIKRLLGFSKVIEKSFISEHMLFKKDYMIELINEIEASSSKGNNFYEKILYAVGKDNLALGFSEFETYGTWIGMRHPSAYTLRNWKSMRNTNFFIDISDITDEDIDWLSKSYDAATFEKYHDTESSLNELFKNPRYREKLTPEQFYISILESGIMGDYSNGVLTVNGFSMPI